MSTAASERLISRVLIVEDNPSQLRTLVEIMIDEGFDVISCSSGAEAINHVRREDLGVVVVDLCLSDLCGTELLNNIQSMKPHVPVIIYTGYPSFDSAKDSVNLGAFAYVEKLGDPSELIGHVHRAVRAQIEAALHESEQRFQAVFDNAASGMARADQDGRFIQVNHAFCSFLSYSKEELLTMKFSEVTHPDDCETFISQIAEARVTGRQLVDLEKRFIRENGTVVWGHTTATWLPDSEWEQPVMVATLQDITERKQAENALRISEQHYRNLLDNHVDAVGLTANGKFVYCNENMAKLTRCSLQEILDRSPAEFLTPTDRERAENRVSTIIAAASPTTTEVELLRKDGSTVPVEIRSHVIQYSGEPALLSVLRDITERKRWEQELQAANHRLQLTLNELKEMQEQIIQHERLRAVGQMAAGVAHDLNNTLSPIIGYSEILLLDSDLPADIRQSVETIATAAEDAANVVAQLQEFYRPKEASDSYEVLKLDDLLLQVPDLTRPKWRDEAQRSGRTIEMELDLSDVPALLGSASELRSVVTNLVFNAVDAMPSGGKITLGLHAAGESVVIEVSDTGIGMTEDQCRRCLEPFYTNKGPEGTGLGLSVCHGIVRRHGGRIDIDSVTGRGTTVRIQLPAAVEDNRRVDVSVPQVSPAWRILYIDDDSRLRHTMSEMSKHLGLQVDMADGGLAGLKMLQGNPYDVVITDLGMPEVDGRSIIRTVRKLSPDVPVILLTGWGSPLKADEIGEEEMPDYVLGKPPTLSKLRGVLEEVRKQLESTDEPVRPPHFQSTPDTHTQSRDRRPDEH